MKLGKISDLLIKLREPKENKEKNIAKLQKRVAQNGPYIGSTNDLLSIHQILKNNNIPYSRADLDFFIQHMVKEPVNLFTHIYSLFPDPKTKKPVHFLQHVFHREHYVHQVNAAKEDILNLIDEAVQILTDKSHPYSEKNLLQYEGVYQILTKHFMKGVKLNSKQCIQLLNAIPKEHFNKNIENSNIGLLLAHQNGFSNFNLPPEELMRVFLHSDTHLHEYNKNSLGFLVAMFNKSSKLNLNQNQLISIFNRCNMTETNKEGARLIDIIRGHNQAEALNLSDNELNLLQQTVAQKEFLEAIQKIEVPKISVFKHDLKSFNLEINR